MFKKLASIACVIALAMTSLTSIAFADTTAEAVIVQAPSNRKLDTKNKRSFVTLKYDGIAGQYVNGGSLYFYVTKDVFQKSENLTMLYTTNDIHVLEEDVDTGDMKPVKPAGAAKATLVDASDSAVDESLKKDGYDLISYTFSNDAGMLASTGNAVTLRLNYASDIVAAEFIPAGYTVTLVSDNTTSCTKIAELKKTYSGENSAKYKYTLSATDTTITQAEIGGTAETTPVITPAEGQTVEEAVKSFANYVDATKFSGYVNENDAEDIATGFKVELPVASKTDNLIWKVTDGTDTKYRKVDITGADVTGSGNVMFGLAVKGLDGTPEAVKAGAAFLK